MYPEASLNQKFLDEGLNIKVRFTKNSLNDLKGFQKEIQKRILSLIFAQGLKGPLLKPDGIGAPLHPPLNGFAKIKSKSINIRVIYRPVTNSDYIIMEIIAIGPRDRKLVYKIAAERKLEFLREMNK